MKSFRDYVSNVFLDKLLDDVKEIRIFNEADMQYRAAHHLDKVCYPDLYLTNQPIIPVGRGRGKNNVKPDIVIFHHTKGPVAAIELKCFVGKANEHVSKIIDYVWRDIEKLMNFKSRYQDSNNTFAIVLVNNQDNDCVDAIKKELGRQKEEWMKHYLFTHIINVYCNENGRKRPWYDQWKKEFESWNKYFGEL